MNIVIFISIQISETQQEFSFGAFFFFRSKALLRPAVPLFSLCVHHMCIVHRSNSFLA